MVGSPSYHNACSAPREASRSARTLGVSTARPGLDVEARGLEWTRALIRGEVELSTAVMMRDVSLAGGLDSRTPADVRITLRREAAAIGLALTVWCEFRDRMKRIERSRRARD